MNLKIVYLLLRVVLIISLLWTTPPLPAFASGVVGTGTPGSCTEAALDAALVGEQHAVEVDAALHGISGVDGVAAGEQRHRESRPTVVSQRADAIRIGYERTRPNDAAANWNRREA